MARLMMQITTSIVIPVPPAVQALVVPLLRRYTDATLPSHLPAHISVLFPFVPAAALEAACQRLRGLCAQVPPFDVTLRGYNHFPRAVYLELSDPGPVRALFRRIQAAFPDCAPYEGAYGPDIIPHVTAAQFASEAACAAAEFPPYTPVTFRVARINVDYGVAESGLPWITYATIPLGGVPGSPPDTPGQPA
ncbi:MAG: 2'-5' RNA ligase family protein [Chloroflexi bacterium]|nr:2'-5' RNA ligase family protein [Chloroflexota bacterium]